MKCEVGINASRVDQTENEADPPAESATTVCAAALLQPPGQRYWQSTARVAHRKRFDVNSSGRVPPGFTPTVAESAIACRGAMESHE